MIKQQLKKIRDLLKDLCWMGYGPRLFTRLRTSRPHSLHFICKGNICRSAFAHHYGRAFFANSALAGLYITSSGLSVGESESPPVDAVAMAEQHGVSLFGHSSVATDLQMCEEADMILVMEGWQLKELRRRFPATRKKSYLLAQFDPDGDKLFGYRKFNIIDPYGKGEESFAICFQRIVRCLEGLQQQIDHG